MKGQKVYQRALPLPSMKHRALQITRDLFSSIAIVRKGSLSHMGRTCFLHCHKLESRSCAKGFGQQTFQHSHLQLVLVAHTSKPDESCSLSSPPHRIGGDIACKFHLPLGLYMVECMKTNFLVF